MKPADVRGCDLNFAAHDVVSNLRTVQLTNYAEINLQVICEEDPIEAAKQILGMFVTLLPGRHQITADLIEAFYNDITNDMPQGRLVIPLDVLLAWYKRTTSGLDTERSSLIT